MPRRKLKENPHSCQFCSQAFKTIKGLKQHQDTSSSCHLVRQSHERNRNQPVPNTVFDAMSHMQAATTLQRNPRALEAHAEQAPRSVRTDDALYDGDDMDLNDVYDDDDAPDPTQANAFEEDGAVEKNHDPVIVDLSIQESILAEVRTFASRNLKPPPSPANSADHARELYRESDFARRQESASDDDDDDDENGSIVYRAPPRIYDEDDDGKPSAVQPEQPTIFEVGTDRAINLPGEISFNINPPEETQASSNNCTDQEIRNMKCTRFFRSHCNGWNSTVLPTMINASHNLERQPDGRYKIYNIPLELPKLWTSINEVFPHSATDAALLQLLSLTNQANAPHYMFPMFISWVHSMIDLNIIKWSDPTKVLKRTKRPVIIRHLLERIPVPRFNFQWIPMENKKTREILNGSVWFDELQSRDQYLIDLDKYSSSEYASALVPSCSIKDQIISLLNDERLFGDLDNVNLNKLDFPNKLFDPYESTPDGSGTIDEMISAEWYRDTVRRRQISGDDFLLPIILYVDKTGTDAYQRYGLEPVIITTALLKRKIRSLDHAWVPIGFVPDLELRSKSEKARDRITLMRGSSNRNYQMCMRVILSSLLSLQQTGFGHFFRVGKYMKFVRIIPELCCVMGDGKSGDCITGRFGNHQWQVRRQCRACWTMFEDLDKSEKNTKECRWIHSYQLAFPIALAYADGILASDSAPLTSGTDVANNQTLEDDEDVYLCSDADEDESPEQGVARDQPPKKSRRKIPQQEKAERKSKASAKRSKRRRENEDVDDNDDTRNGQRSFDSDALLDNHPLLDHNNVITELRRLLGNQTYSVRNADFEQHADDQLKEQELETIWSLFKERYNSPEAARHLLRLMSQHQSILAFHDISFGGDSFGVSGLSPTDCLHNVKLGIWKYIASHVILLMGPKARSELDVVAKSVIKPQRQSESKYFPRWNFSHGITSLSMLTADEWGGVILSLILLLNTKRGMDIFVKGSKKNVPSDFDETNILYILEQILCFHAWLCFGPFWKLDDRESESSARISICNMMDDIKKYVPRKEGNGWKLTKFHELLHIPRDIRRLGCPMGYDACVGEKMLKSMAKRPARSAQMRSYPGFLKQVAKRLEEHRLVEKAKGLYNTVDRSDQPPDNVGFAEDDDVSQSSNEEPEEELNDHDMSNMNTLLHKFWENTVVMQYPTGHIASLSEGVKYNAPGNELPVRITNFVKDDICHMLYSAIDTIVREDEDAAQRGETGNTIGAPIATCWSEPLKNGSYIKFKITGYTEAIVRSHDYQAGREKTIYHPRQDDVVAKGIRFRCHPNYMSEGGWNDWALISFQADPESRKQNTRTREKSELCGVPSKVLAIVDFTLESMSMLESRNGEYLDVCDYVGNNIPKGRRNYIEDVVNVDSSKRMLVWMAGEFVHSSVITERWTMGYSEREERHSVRRGIAPASQHTPSDKRDRFPRWKLVRLVEACDRAACFTDVVNVIDPFDANKDDPEDERKYVCVLYDRESKWGKAFLE